MTSRAALGKRLRATVREPVWSATNAVLRPTAAWRVLPDYLVIGAQRAGTTSLQSVLAQHPNVSSARWMKGVHYFDTGYHRSPEWYRTHFPTRAHARRVERRTGAPLRCGEASPYYVFHPLAVERIAADLPDARLVVLLRDPVERTLSHHKHEVRRGNEPLDLLEALDAEPDRLRGEADRIVAGAPFVNSFAHQTFSYVERSRYGPQISRLFDHVGRDKVLVLQSEQLFGDPAAVLERVLAFLQLPHWSPPRFPRENATVGTEVPIHVRERLRAEFAASNEQLFALIGERFSW